MRFLTYREYLYHVTGSSWVSVRFLSRDFRFTPQRALYVGTKILFHNILQVYLCISFQGHGLLARFVAQYFHLPFYHNSWFVHALSQFLLYSYMFPLISLWQNLVSGIYITNYADIGCPLIEINCF
jgi:hypothetical protein